ncbi:DUF4142 domain-containing protein [Flavobacteriaceae bacterium F89]|uniref:DUF4142 domain-containing protein n=1 Tax=Cerina litoralis TaxID=2874477 RepID=A0AAE3EYJ9_9FLAO|nr:DUF4142 domain-containing protein [Cerina litoralis]MCG2462534.1 DUF4142 domain-containing protein [Cerina litoralis]
MNVLKSTSAALLFTAALISMPSMAQSSNTPQLTDPEIASVAVTANQIDVDYGKIALKKAKNEKARKFAQTMIDDHTAIIDQAVALANKLGVTPKDNAVTQSLLDGAKKTTKTLKGKKGKDFDKAYIDNEVGYHEAVISTVKNVLIPETQNAELKELLQSAVPLLEHHLEMAKTAQSNL